MVHERLTNGDKRSERFYPKPDEMLERLLANRFRNEIARYMKMKGEPLETLLEWPQHRGGTLVDVGIMRHMIAGNIIIHRFNSDHLQPNSYDVALGKYIYRWKHNSRALNKAPYNPLDMRNVRDGWKLEEAVSARKMMEENGMEFKGIEENDEIILLYPNQMILGHTEEYIGGLNLIIPDISGKSTSGRNLIEMCSDARMGNIGFVNRYTLEIFNKTPDTHEGMPIVLVAGQTYASFLFQEAVEPPAGSYTGKYADSVDIDEVEAKWVPQMMLPHMRRTPRRELNMEQFDFSTIDKV